MANVSDKQVVDVLAPTTNFNTAGNGPMYGNVWRRKNGWEVRPGFGTLAQLDCLLTVPGAVGMANVGFQKVLGSTLILTDFGHYQIVTVMLGAFSVLSERSAPLASCYVVSIYDVTADTRHDEVLYPHRSQLGDGGSEMQWQSPFYAENASRLTARPIVAVDETVSFTTYQTVSYGYTPHTRLIFAAPNMGAWCYAPCDFGNVPAAAMVDQWRSDAMQEIPGGDSSRVSPIVGATGTFTDAVAYLTGAAAFPRPTAVAVLGDQVVYASGRSLFFSEIGRPDAIPETSVLTLQLSGDITAIAANNGYLYVFTGVESWCFQPGGGTALPGRLIQLADGIGCLGPSAICSRADTLVWASSYGIHTLAGALQMQTISTAIKPLFDDSMPNPLIQFYQANGADPLLLDQCPIEWNWKNVTQVQAAYDPLMKIVYFTVPEQRLCLVLQADDAGNNSWAIWNFDTIVQPLRANVGVRTGLKSPWILCQDGLVFAASGMDAYEAPESGLWPYLAVQPSYVISQLGRGGALDRTCYESEDKRLVLGAYSQIGFAVGEQSYIVIDKPVARPAGYVYPSIGPASSETLAYPFRLYNATQNPVSAISMVLHIPDDWEPVLASGGLEAAAIFPPERAASSVGYTNGIAWDAGTRRLTVLFQGIFAPPDSWATQPSLNISNTEEPLFWIGFAYAGQGDSSAELGASVVGTAWVYDATFPVNVHLFWQAYLTNRNTNDNTAQPTDWWLKSAQLGLNKAQQLRTRGLFVKLLTKGSGAATYATNFLEGVVNAMATSDWKDWSMQIVDTDSEALQPNVQEVFKKNVNDIELAAGAQLQDQAIRSRMWDTDTDETVRVLWGYQSHWEDANSPGDGDTLAGDESLDTLAISASTRGEHISWMLYGHQWNHAGHLLISGVQAVLKVMGGPRRIGR